MKLIWDILTSKAGLIGLVLLAAYMLHLVTLKAAVDRARDGFVLELELTTSEAERRLIQKTLTDTRKANTVLQASQEIAEQALETLELEIAANEARTVVDPNCRVTDRLIGRLR